VFWIDEGKAMKEGGGGLGLGRGPMLVDGELEVLRRGGKGVSTII